MGCTETTSLCGLMNGMSAELSSPPPCTSEEGRLAKVLKSSGRGWLVPADPHPHE